MPGARPHGRFALEKSYRASRTTYPEPAEDLSPAPSRRDPGRVPPLVAVGDDLEGELGPRGEGEVARLELPAHGVELEVERVDGADLGEARAAWRAQLATHWVVLREGMTPIKPRDTRTLSPTVPVGPCDNDIG